MAATLASIGQAQGALDRQIGQLKTQVGMIENRFAANEVPAIVQKLQAHIRSVTNLANEIRAITKKDAADNKKDKAQVLQRKEELRNEIQKVAQKVAADTATLTNILNQLDDGIRQNEALVGQRLQEIQAYDVILSDRINQLVGYYASLTTDLATMNQSVAGVVLKLNSM